MTDADAARQPPALYLDAQACNALERAARIAVPRETDFADDLAEHLDEVARRRRASARALRALLATDPAAAPATVDGL